MEHVQTLAERIGKSFREQVSLVELLKTKAAYLTKNDQYKWLPPTYDEIVKQDPGVVKHEIDILNDRAISEGPSFQDPHHQLPNSPSSNAPSTPTGSIVFTPPGSPTPAFISRTANEMATTAPPTQTRFKLQSTSTALKEEPYDLPGKWFEEIEGTATPFQEEVQEQQYELGKYKKALVRRRAQEAEDEERIILSTLSNSGIVAAMKGFWEQKTL